MRIQGPSGTVYEFNGTPSKEQLAQLAEFDKTKVKKPEPTVRPKGFIGPIQNEVLTPKMGPVLNPPPMKGSAEALAPNIFGAKLPVQPKPKPQTKEKGVFDDAIRNAVRATEIQRQDEAAAKAKAEANKKAATQQLQDFYFKPPKNTPTGIRGLYTPEEEAKADQVSVAKAREYGIDTTNPNWRDMVFQEDTIRSIPDDQLQEYYKAALRNEQGKFPQFGNVPETATKFREELSRRIGNKIGDKTGASELDQILLLAIPNIAADTLQSWMRLGAGTAGPGGSLSYDPQNSFSVQDAFNVLTSGSAPGVDEIIGRAIGKTWGLVKKAFDKGDGKAFSSALEQLSLTPEQKQAFYKAAEDKFDAEAASFRKPEQAAKTVSPAPAGPATKTKEPKTTLKANVPEAVDTAKAGEKIPSSITDAIKAPVTVTSQTSELYGQRVKSWKVDAGGGYFSTFDKSKYPTKEDAIKAFRQELGSYAKAKPAVEDVRAKDVTEAKPIRTIPTEDVTPPKAKPESFVTLNPGKALEDLSPSELNQIEKRLNEKLKAAQKGPAVGGTGAIERDLDTVQRLKERKRIQQENINAEEIRKDTGQVRERGEPSKGLQDKGSQDFQRPKEAGAEAGKPKDEVTGLARQVQEREAARGLPTEAPKGKGMPKGKARDEALKVMDDDPSFPDRTVREIDAKPRPATPVETAAILERKRLMLKETKRLETELSDMRAKGEKTGYAEKLGELEKKRDELQEFVDMAQKGFTQASDTFRELQMGVEIDTGSVTDVLMRRKEVLGRELTPKEKAYWQKEVEQRNRRIAELEAKSAESQSAKAEATVQAFATGRRNYKDVQAVRAAKEEAKARLRTRVNEAFRAASQKGPQNLGLSSLGEYLKAVPGAAKDILDIIRLTVQEKGLIKLDKAFYDAVREEFKDTFSATDDDIRRVLAGVYDEAQGGRPKSAFESLRKEARAAESEVQKINTEMAKADAKRLAELKSKLKTVETRLEKIRAQEKQLETGITIAPTRRVRASTKAQEDLDALIQRNERRIKAMVRERERGAASKFVRNVANPIRQAILGGDIGILTRQGLFAIARPKQFGVGILDAVRASMSEAGLARFENKVQSLRGNDGRLLEPIWRKHGWQVTDTLTNPEEIIVARMLSKIGHGLERLPLIGKRLGAIPGAFERFQSAFINSVRTQDFKRVYDLGFTEKELLDRGRFVNAATGRGNAKQIPEFFNAVMTSPRYELSRWEMLVEPFRNAKNIVKFERGPDGRWVYKGLNRASAQNIQDMAATAGSIFLLYKLAELNGYSVNYDPKSSDFLKMRKGDEVWDPTAGIAPRLRDTIRLALIWDDPKYGSTLKTLGGNVVARTITPAIKTPVEQSSMARQRAKGQEKAESPFSGFEDKNAEGWIAWSPLIIQTFKETLEKEGAAKAFGAASREFLGQSVSRYPKKEEKKSGGLFYPK